MTGLQIARRQTVGNGAGLLGLFRNLATFWGRRDLLWHMTVRHLRGQYKQSVLGYAWAIVNPLSQTLIIPLRQLNWIEKVLKIDKDQQHQ